MFDLRPLACGFGERHPGGSPPPATIEVAPMVPGRVPAVALIDRMSLAPPWTEAEFHRTFEGTGRYGVVALFGPHARVVGYCVCALDGGDSAVRVIRFATDENLRRRGVMRRLFARVSADAEFTSHRRIEVPVHEANVAARRFLQAIGFRGEGLIRGYYGDRDAYRMTKPVGVCMGK